MLTTTVGPDTHIDASATNNGDGGTVVLWFADEETDFNGAILARGGMLGGNGVQMSKHRARVNWAYSVTVSASATHGSAGTWLLDPVDITVSSAPDANYTPWFTPTGDPVTVNNGSLSNALQGGTSVTLDASKGTGGSGSSLSPHRSYRQAAAT